MSDNLSEITCVRCGQTWQEDLARLDKKDLIIYRGEAQPKRYRVTCPRCGTVNVVTVET
jgi:ribosomal protein S27AE